MNSTSSSLNESGIVQVNQSMIFDQDLADTTLIVEKQELHVNIWFLAVKSRLFKAILKSRRINKRCDFNFISLPVIKFDAVKKIVEHAYGVQLNFKDYSTNELLDILRAALKLCKSNLVCC